MDKKEFTRMKIVFSLVIVLSFLWMIIHSIPWGMSSYANLIGIFGYHDKPLFFTISSRILFVVVQTLYFIGFSLLAKFKGYSGRLWLSIVAQILFLAFFAFAGFRGVSEKLEFFGLIPVIGLIFFALSLKNKNKGKEAVARIIDYRAVFILAVLAVILPLGMNFANPYLIKFKYEYNSDTMLAVIKLTNSKDDKKIIYETDDFIFSFGVNDFLSIIYDKSRAYPIVYKEDRWRPIVSAYIDQNISKKNEILLVNLPEMSDRRRTVDDFMMTLIDYGKFTLYDKKHKRYIGSVDKKKHMGRSSISIRYVIRDYNFFFDKVIFERVIAVE